MMRLFQHSRSATAILLSGTLLLTGCADSDLPNPLTSVGRVFNGVSNEELPGMTSEERKFNLLAQEAERTTGIGILGGAALGAAAGALLCKDARVQCALGLGAAGAAVGYFAGFYLANLKRNVELEQDGLRSDISAAKGSIAEYKQRADLAERIYAQNRRKLLDLDRAYEAGSGSLKAYSERYAIVQQQRDQISAYVSQAEADVNVLEASIATRSEFRGEDTKNLEREKRRLETQIARLTKQRENYDALIDTVPGAVKDAADV